MCTTGSGELRAARDSERLSQMKYKERILGVLHGPVAAVECSSVRAA